MFLSADSRSAACGFSFKTIADGLAVLAASIAFLSGVQSANGASAEPFMASVPGNGSIVLKDYNYRNWGPELVHYQVDTATFIPGRLVLLNSDGIAVPFQINGDVLSFVAQLNKNQTTAYTLQSSVTDRSGENSSISVATVGSYLEIGNSQFTLRVPTQVDQELPTPVNVSQVPVPVVGIKHAGGAWYGSSHIVTDRQIASYHLGIIENGKAAVTYEARYRFSPGGEYVCRIQVLNGLSYALFTEEFDFGAMTQGRDFLIIDLASGWSPDTYRYMYGGFGGGESPLLTGAIESSALNTYVNSKTTEWNNWSASGPPKPYQPGGATMVLLDRMNQTGAYGPRSAVGLSNSTQAVYILPMHGGIWRRSMSITTWNDPAGGVKVALPIGVRPLQSFLDLTGDTSPFATMTHDSGVPETYGRRMWALCCGLSDTAVADVHQRAGVIGLDRYKNWILNWSLDSSKSFPRSQTTPALVARLKNAINSHPEKSKLQTCYVITGNSQDAINNANSALAQLRTPSANLTSWERNWAFTSYRDCDFSYWMIRAEDALSYPGLSASLRDELRQRIALFSYWLSEPDLYESGTGTHLGTVNMRIGRWLAGLYYASLLPDHPLYDYWMTRYRDVVSYLLGNTESVGGAWYEPPTYQTFGPTRWLTASQAILRNAGYLDYGPKGYWTRMLQYTADITVYDPRFPNKRILPGMGDSGNTLEGMFGIGMGIVEGSDAPNARFFTYMHSLNSIAGRVSRSGGAGDSANPDFSFQYMNDVGEQSRALTTTYTPGYGVSFRAHYGNTDETSMLFRCGYTRSHWAVDDLNVLLYSKGAPLSPGNAHQYYHGVAEQTGPMRNQCRVVNAAQHLPNGRIHTDVQDYGFGASADYAVGRMYLSGEELGDGKGEMEWRRHILFLKSSQPSGANYFVMRDSFTGYEGAPASTGRAAWWTWTNLDTADRVKVNGTAFSASQVANETVTAESSWPALTGDTIEMGTAYGASSWFWFDTPSAPMVKAVMKMNYTVDPADYQRDLASLQTGIPATGSAESKTIFRIQGNADTGFFYVVYPRKGTEATPACSRLAAGVLKIITSESTDYVFVGDSAFNYDQNGIRFTGRSGAVRVFADRVVFCMNSGTGEIGCNGSVISGAGPFERTVLNANRTAGTTNLGGVAKVIRTVDIGSGISVRGEDPFSATLEGRTIKIHTEGRARQFIVANLPDWLLNTRFTLDGQEWLALRSDEAAQNWGRYARSSGVCFSTIDGTHDLELSQRTSWPAPWADMMSVNIATTIPAEPTSLAVTPASSKRLNLSWVDNSINEAGYKIERKTGAGGSFVQVATVSSNTTSYQDASLTANTAYFYRVSATNSAGDSAFSNEAGATTQSPPALPAAPTSLSGTAPSHSQINLSWTDNATNETGFRIERKTGADGSYSEISATGPDIANYQDTPLIPETTYYYRLRAINEGGESGYSNDVIVTTQPPPPPPAAPSNLNASAISGSRIDLAWTDGSNSESAFIIERKTGAGGVYSQIATAQADVTSYSDTSLTAGTSYYYRVRASNPSGDSVYTNEANASAWSTVVTPTFAPTPGGYDSVQSVTLDSTTTGAFIRYTTDGSAPTSTDGTLYSAAIPIGVSTTIKAIAYKTGMTDSAVATGAYTIGEPTWEGILHNNNIASRDGTLETSLKNAGYGILLYGSPPTTNPSTPGWWSGAASYSQISGTRTAYDWNGIKWNGANRIPLCGEGDQRGGVAKISINPSVTANISRKMAVILSTWDSAGSVTVQLTTIKVGSTTTALNKSLTASAGKASVGQVLLRLRPGEPVEITLSYSGVAWSGISLAFADGANGPAGPLAPSGLSANAVSNSQINLSWTDNSSDETGFEIERKTGAGGTWAQIATPAANATSYSDTALTASTQYYYRILAVNSSGDSASSNECSATTPAASAASPTYKGLLVDNVYPINSAFSDTLHTAGYKYLLYNTAQASPSIPPWWSGAATRVTTGQNYAAGSSFSWNPTNGGAAISAPPLLGWAGTSGTCTVTFTNNLTARAKATMAVIVATKNGGGPLGGTGGYNNSCVLTGIVMSGVTTSFNRNLMPTQIGGWGATDARAVVQEFQLDMAPGDIIQVMISDAGYNQGGVYLAFSDAQVDTPVVAPSFSPVAGTYTSAQSVTIISTTSGAAIRYTTDGSTPSQSVGTIYSSPVSISASTMLKAIAYKSGMNDSARTSGDYVIQPPASVFDQWRQSKFSTAQIADPAISGPYADPDSDSLNNLLEYALDRDPRAAEVTPPTTGNRDANGKLTITFKRARPASDLTYQVFGSPDLFDWTQQIGPDNPGTVGIDVMVTDSPPANSIRRFLHLKVTTP
jgi:hypothetical protein